MGYQVKRGDTLSAIALRHGTTVADIVKANPQIKNPDHIETGWTLVLPAPSRKQMPGGSDGFSHKAHASHPRNMLDGLIHQTAQQLMQQGGTSSPARPPVDARPRIPPTSVTVTDTAPEVETQPAQIGETLDPPADDPPPAQGKAADGSATPKPAATGTATPAAAAKTEETTPTVIPAGNDPAKTAAAAGTPTTGTATPAITADPAQNTSGPGAAAATGDVAALTDAATKAEAKVMDQATQLAQTADPQAAQALTTDLKASFTDWQKSVAALVGQGQLDSPQVKSFAQKTEQAAMLQTNLPAATKALTGSAYKDAVQDQISKDTLACKGMTPESVATNNPLLNVPPLSAGASLAAAKARGIPTTTVSINGKSGEARTDVVMVFAPGVARTGTEFNDMRDQALLDGVASTRAETGTFIDPDQNADAIAAAIKQGKEMVGNPNAKVVLVGYSQGNTNVYAFMRDKDNKYGDLLKDVVGIHDIHSAAKGSQLADFAFAAGQYLCTSKPLTDYQSKLIDAFCQAQATQFGHPDKAKDFRAAFTALHDAFKVGRGAIKVMDKIAPPVMKKLGLHGLTDEQINMRLFQMAVKGDKIDALLAKHGGEAGKMAAKTLAPVMATLGSTQAQWIKDPSLSPFFQQYIDGGLRSLTTDYCNELMTDPKLQEHLKGVAILNSVGAIPQDRETDLVPNSQKLLYGFFNALGLENDYEVALPFQRLEDVIPHAVDLPPDAIGHWGVTGVLVPVDHPAKYFADWSPPGMTHAVLGTFDQLGVF